MNYEAVMGLEIHAQLKTNSKLFCSCPTEFGAEPNTQVCPICLGMPGVLPVVNKKAVEYAVRMALATGCTINEKSVFARKNYFYPDLPKGYQISQFDLPLAEHGHLEIEVDGNTKRIGITRIHMEDDAGKLLHADTSEDEGSSLVDLNRTGTPLIEIVSEPDIRSPEEASAYFKAIRDILVYLDVCDCNMEEGSLRCDVNTSVRPVGQKEFGTRTELKNMNSFKFIRDAAVYDINRHIEAIEDGEKIIQETRLCDVAKGVTRSMRTKEEAHDYRYFPDPDLLPLMVDATLISEARGALPELPAEKKARFVTEYKLPPYDAGVLTAQKAVADWFEECVGITKDAKTVSNWVMGELMRLLKETGEEIGETKVTPKGLAALLTLLKDGAINAKQAKEVFEEIFKTGKDGAAIVEDKGFKQVSDEGDLEKVIDEILAANAENVERYKAGQDKLMGFFVGQVMKATKGQGNPGVVNKLLKKKLGK